MSLSQRKMGVFTGGYPAEGAVVENRAPVVENSKVSAGLVLAGRRHSYPAEGAVVENRAPVVENSKVSAGSAPISSASLDAVSASEAEHHCSTLPHAGSGKVR